MNFNEHFIVSVIPEARFIGVLLPSNISCSIDSRTIRTGDIFFALKGEYHDVHDFVDHAVRSGASSLVIALDHENCLEKLTIEQRSCCSIILVPSPREALIALAHAWRNQFSIPVVGVTGSVGKTITKELLGSIVSRAGKNYVVSPGNQNTLIGCALTLLRMTAEHEGVII